MNYQEALAAGYRPADVRLTRGYVSRKNFVLDQAECHEAGGYRKGQLYVLCPNWRSTEYSYRQYLRKEE